MSYEPQVGKEHYRGAAYDTLERFVSYYLQKDLVFNCLQRTPGRVLEVGAGTGFLRDYLEKNGAEVKTFDIAADLAPDYVGDVTGLRKAVAERFAVVCCFEVLEHIRFEDLATVFDQFAETATGYAIVSVPQTRVYLSFWLKVPKAEPVSFYLGTAAQTPHAFDGEHYWELDARGYGSDRFRDIVSRRFSIEREFTHPLDTYHRFFVLRTRHDAVP
jgi:2-polyprenyl-3-methyl-5-hydroxy-6-metoxy-1,4-benzoquinol methylase